MSFHNRSFERKVRKLARRELKQSQLWKEYKRLKPNRLRNVNGGWIGVLWLGAIAVGYLSSKPASYAFLAITLYGLSAVLNRSIGASTLLYQSQATYNFIHLPVTDRNIFGWHIRYLLRSSITMLILFAMGYGVVFRGQLFTTESVVTILALAIIQWLTCCAAILVVVPFLPKRTAGLGFFAYGAGLAAFFCAFVPESIINGVQQALVITPAGSLSYFVKQYFFHHHFSIAALLPTFAYIAAMPIALQRLCRSYNTDILSDRLFGATATEQSAELEPAEEDPAISELSTAEAERVIYNQFPSDPNREPQVGWVDRLIFKRLSLREKVICNFFRGGGTGSWTWHWSKGAIAAIITIVLAIAPAGLVSAWIWVPGVLAVMLALPLFGGMWTGFTELPISGKLSPIYATYPIAFDEISGLLFKVNTLRILLWSPFFIAIGVAILRVYSVEPRTAFVYSLVSLYGLVTFQPFQWCGKFSSGSNDSKVTKLRPILAITALVFGFLLFGGLFVFVLAVPPYWNIASALAMPITSLATWLIYRWAYNTPSFDLVHDVRGH